MKNLSKMREAEPSKRLVPAEKARCGLCSHIDGCPRNARKVGRVFVNKVSMRGELVPKYFAERCNLFEQGLEAK